MSRKIILDSCLRQVWKDEFDVEHERKKRRPEGSTPDVCTWHVSLICPDHFVPAEGMAEPRERESRYLVENNEAGGYLAVSRRDGGRMSHEELVWLRNMIAISLRAEQIGEYKANSRGAARVAGLDVDELVLFLGEQHKKRRIPLSHFGRAIMAHTTTLTETFKGKRRAALDLVRPWAYFMGFDIVAVPFAMKDTVREMVRKHLAENHLDTAFYSEEEGNAGTEEGISN